MPRLAVNDPYDVALGLAVRNVRRAKGASMEEVGNVLGVSYQQIQKYETGASRLSVKALCQIASYLETPVPEFLPGGRADKPSCSKIYVEADDETILLIKYWRRINVLKIRRFIIAFVKEMLRSQSHVSSLK